MSRSKPQPLQTTDPQRIFTRSTTQPEIAHTGRGLVVILIIRKEAGASQTKAAPSATQSHADTTPDHTTQARRNEKL